MAMSELNSTDSARGHDQTSTYQAGEPSGSNMIEVTELVKVYRKGAQDLRVLDGLSLNIRQGAFDALMGPSGSGKSTLLNIIAGLDQADEGRVRVAGAELARLSDAERANWRAQNIGFVFQTYNLMPVLTALENVELPLLLTSLPKAERRKRAATALRVVGLEARSDHFPAQLSGGQEQRVSIARAIVTDPKLIVADEPTGDLDRSSANEILTLLQKLNSEFNKTILMVTHDPVAAERAGIVHHLDKGRLEGRAS